jgi:molybdate transport system substrate-binding protein
MVGPSPGGTGRPVRPASRSGRSRPWETLLLPLVGLARLLSGIFLLSLVPLPGARAGLVTNLPAGTVLIAAASDLVFALDSLKTAFTKEHPEVSLKATTGASGSLFAQIRNGAPFDVFLAADRAYPTKLAESGHAELPSLFTYAEGHLILWTTRTNLSLKDGLACLLDPGFRHIAIANPETAPYGRAARAALVQAGIWDRVQSRVVIAENIAQAAQFVDTGTAEAGLVSASLLMRPEFRERGAREPVPPALHPPILQGAILTRSGATNPAAKAFLEFLRSDMARDLLAKSGLTPPTGTNAATATPPPGRRP